MVIFSPGNLATLSLLVNVFGPLSTFAYDSYPNDFIDPATILSGKYNNRTQAAQKTLIAWADELNAQSPWSVTNKKYLPPSSDKHDYMSWSPYWWPDCTGVGNTTELRPEVVWTTCRYVNRDGQFNPDISLITDNWSFQNLSDAILYNAVIWAFQNNRGSTVYSKSAVNFLSTWFLDPDKRMNPNLNYAQVIRGPQKWQGTHTGVLDLKCFAKIACAIEIFRKGNASDWTAEIDNGIGAWVKEYMNWLETSELGIGERQSTNNHGTYYYNQLAALKIIVNDTAGAKASTEMYFDNQYQIQIDADGKQPLELSRTRPYHYTAYNLAAMITNARLATYTGNSTVWNLSTHSGATIKTALDYALTLNASKTNEVPWIDELIPSVGAVAVVYGDPNGSYVRDLDGLQNGWDAQGWVVWDQPLEKDVESGATNGSSTTSKTNDDKKVGANALLLALVGLLVGCFL